jgi:hypothetical protein
MLRTAGSFTNCASGPVSRCGLRGGATKTWRPATVRWAVATHTGQARPGSLCICMQTCPALPCNPFMLPCLPWIGAGLQAGVATPPVPLLARVGRALGCSAIRVLLGIPLMCPACAVLCCAAEYVPRPRRFLVEVWGDEYRQHLRAGGLTV